MTSVDNVATGLAILDALERETRISRLGQLQDREDYRAVMMVERVEQFDVFLPVQVCATTLSARLLSRICSSPLSMSTHQLEPLIISITYLVVIGTVPPAFLAESRENGRSGMETKECGESKSGIIDTSCLFCVAG